MFDPTHDEAMAAEETAEKPPGTLREQPRRGWKMGDPVLRPAGVRVAKAPARGDMPRQDPSQSSAPKNELGKGGRRAPPSQGGGLSLPWLFWRRYFFWTSILRGFIVSAFGRWIVRTPSE